MADLGEIRVIFDGAPGHESGRFVELENEHGAGIGLGEWVENDGYWELRIKVEDVVAMASAKAREPVLPVSTYCKAISTWLRLKKERIQAECRETEASLEPLEEAASRDFEDVKKEASIGFLMRKRHRLRDTIHLLRSVEIDIRKSGMLYRMLYLGEKLRTKKCPVHKGKMDTGMWTLRQGEVCACQGSGWLPEPEDVPAPPPDIDLVTGRPTGPQPCKDCGDPVEIGESWTWSGSLKLHDPASMVTPLCKGCYTKRTT